MKEPLHQAALQRPLVSDGAMGTQLMIAGLEAGGCGEEWNLIFPARIEKIQRLYVEAGADCLITNTFGASRIMLKRHRIEGKVRQINEAGVRIARRAFGDKAGYVLGDIGPLGALLEPYGELSVADASDAYREQAAALMQAGADGIIIETHTGLEEVGLAIDAAKEAGAPCVIASMSYDLSTDKKFFVTMMGVMPQAAGEFAEQRGAHIVALNCGTGTDMNAAAEVVRVFRKSCRLPVMVQPNAGLPELEGGTAVYKQSPAEMAAGVPAVLAAGGRIVGSCCGSTPDHTKAIRAAVDHYISGA